MARNLTYPRRPLHRRLLKPPALWRVDRFLVTRFPLVWRTQVLTFLFGVAGLGSLAMLAASRLLPLSPTRPSSPSALATSSLVLLLAGVVLLLWWVYAQVRSPIHELRPRRYVVLTLLHAVCVFAVLATPSVFLTGVVTRIAELHPDAEFSTDFAFLEGNQWWMCADDEGAPLVRPRAELEANLSEIVQALARYGLEGVTVEPWSPDCNVVTLHQPGRGGGAPVVQPPAAIRSLMMHIRDAKLFREGAGSYRRFVRRLWLFGIVSVVCGALLTGWVCGRRLLSSYAERRVRITAPKLRLPVPRFVTRLDDYLLTHRPVLWSARAPKTLFYVLFLTFAAVATEWLTGPHHGYEAVWVTLALSLAGPLIWMRDQRDIPLPGGSVEANRQALAFYVLVGTLSVCILWVGIALIELETTRKEPTTYAPFVGVWLLLALCITGGVFASKFLGDLPRIAQVAAGGSVLFAALLATFYLGTILTLVFIGAFLVWRRLGRPVSRAEAIVAGALLVLAPYAVARLIAYVAGALEGALRQAGTASSIVAGLALITAYVLVYTILARAIVTALVGHRYAPAGD